jgi:hypothetical protein
MDNEKVVDTSVNESVEDTQKSEGAEVVETEATENVEDVKARLAKAEELAQNYKVRAEKAEKARKSIGEVPVQKTDELNQKDVIALIKADVTESEDIDEVVAFAQLKKISIADALKTNLIKSLINEKLEQRKIASATNTGTSKRGVAKVTDETILSKASKGELPTSDDDMIRLVRARKGLKN